jgi:3-deoxy-D-manno-octulosonate 8-phosphate phosphatase (KDO 8-P phosphatase)
MSDSLIYLTERFNGSFVTKPELIQEKLAKIKAYVFDWDGVFNNGQKDESGSSPFNEVDAMGSNMLRFSHYLKTGDNPIIAVISGERNKAAFTLADREHFHAVYCGIKFKAEALQHLCDAYNIAPEEVAFVFDDVLDLSVSAVAGLRVMVSRLCNPLLIDFAVQHEFVDYLTALDGNHGAFRETVELLIGLRGNYAETITERMNFTAIYQEYLQERNKTEPQFYTSKKSKIIEDKNK